MRVSVQCIGQDMSVSVMFLTSVVTLGTFGLKVAFIVTAAKKASVCVFHGSLEPVTFFGLNKVDRTSQWQAWIRSKD